ncbi:MAG: hypothetical protein WAJ85_15480 [Candidatus Baltobacteraceae bacterium]|jgi:hypothetical protein
MAYDLRKPPAHQTAPSRALSTRDIVQMKPPAHPVKGVIVGAEPLVSGGVRYWQVAWTFAGEERIRWSPESSMLRFDPEIVA